MFAPRYMACIGEFCFYRVGETMFKMLYKRVEFLSKSKRPVQAAVLGVFVIFA